MNPTAPPQPSLPVTGGNRPVWLRRPPVGAVPTVVTLAAAILYLVLAPSSLDLAAAEYRASLFGQTGFAVWDAQWYAGHYLPAYSVLVPALSWLVGVRWLGVLATVTATAFFQRLTEVRGSAGRVASTWFGLGCVASLCCGRITFTAGIPVALAALLVVESGQRRASARWAGAFLLSAMTALVSPIAALFLAVAWTTLGLSRGDRRCLMMLAGTFAPIVALNLAFPEIGVEPLSPAALLPVAIAVGGAWWVLRPRRSPLLVGAVVYLAACGLCVVLHTAVGANVLRLGPLCAGPLFALELYPRRRLLLGLLALPLLGWQWTDALSDMRAANADPSTQRAFYQPLLHYLDAVSGPGGQAAHGGFRVEIPFTRLHWEARWVAPRYALARGWERQVDVADNRLFYAGHLTTSAYRLWLHRDAVRYVALPRTRLDYSAQQERRIILSHPGFLHRAWGDAEWQVFQVGDPTRILEGRGRLDALSSDTATLTVPAPETLDLRVRWNPFWTIEGGGGCVSRDGSWTRLALRQGGRVRLGERFAFDRLGARTPRCG